MRGVGLVRRARQNGNGETLLKPKGGLHIITTTTVPFVPYRVGSGTVRPSLGRTKSILPLGWYHSWYDFCLIFLAG